MICVYKEERRRQLEVKLIIEEQLRLRRAEEKEQEKGRREEELREMEEKKREAAKSIKRFNERVQSHRHTHTNPECQRTEQMMRAEYFLFCIL